jgi:methylenetetrahydrofolate reductase (NADPH)
LTTVAHNDTGTLQLQRLARAATVELIPIRGVEEKLSLVPAETTLAITCSPKLGVERTLEYVERAIRAGHPAVPHLAARQVRDEQQLRGYVERLGELQVSDLYVIGGDAEQAAGPYSSAGELLQALAGIDHGFKRIGVACYPEGHATIPDATLAEALLCKQQHADYMVSQLCFDPAALVGWLRRARGQGIELPLRIGLAAPMTARKLIDLSIKIGVGSSLSYLAKQHGLVRNLLFGRAYRPERLLETVLAEPDIEALAIEGLHLFSFNQLDLTVGWQQRIGCAETRKRDTGPRRRRERGHQ